MTDRSNSGDDVTELPTVNRFGVTLLPTEEFARWARSCFAEDPDFTLADFQTEPTVYLLPVTDRKLEQVIRQHFKQMLTQELMGWCTDQSKWPELSYVAFREFFEVYITSMVFDLGSAPLETDN